ncbi:MAG: WYL domain-containing protein [Erysipelotrichia bacterium]|nr:WYL domain-containing protein [Erysipelotrichia bacterium]
MPQITNQTVRVLELLKRFNDGQKVCIDALEKDELWEGKSEKTIRRDLEVIKEYFPNSFELIRGGKGERGCYKAITQSTFDNFLKPDALSLLIQTFNIAQRSDLFDSFDMSSDEKKILDSKINQVNKYYEFKNKPLESKKDDYKLFKKLEQAIELQKYLILEYPDYNGVFEKKEVKPYKIVFIQENFYLACEVEHENYEFSMFRISKIRSTEDTKKTYQKNPDIIDFIKFMQTPFAIYRQDFRKYLIDVVLEVDKSKAFFFHSKKFLRSQTLLDTKENGNLIITYKVTQLREIDALIKQWLPYVKVIEPQELKDQILNELKAYVENQNA